jgi:hypothetical protein
MCIHNFDRRDYSGKINLCVNLVSSKRERASKVFNFKSQKLLAIITCTHTRFSFSLKNMNEKSMAHWTCDAHNIYHVI